MTDGVEKIQAGQAGLEPATPAFGERCSAKLSYWPVCISELLIIFCKNRKLSMLI
jgi:hypothetical protein